MPTADGAKGGWDVCVRGWGLQGGSGERDSSYSFSITCVVQGACLQDDRLTRTKGWHGVVYVVVLMARVGRRHKTRWVAAGQLRCGLQPNKGKVVRVRPPEVAGHGAVVHNHVRFAAQPRQQLRRLPEEQRLAVDVRVRPLVHVRVEKERTGRPATAVVTKAHGDKDKVGGLWGVHTQRRRLHLVDE